MSIEAQNGNFAKPMLVAVVDRQVRQLSDMQLELIQQEAISIEDYNEISELIGNLKEYMINCRSYNGN
jgi:predicted transposase YdaD